MTHDNADFDAVASMFAAYKLDPTAVPVLPKRVNRNVDSLSEEAAEALKLTASHLHTLGVVDRVVSEPPGGAHRDTDTMAGELKRVLYEELDYLEHFDADTLVEKRLNKYRKIGYFTEESS